MTWDVEWCALNGEGVSCAGQHGAGNHICQSRRCTPNGQKSKGSIPFSERTTEQPNT